MLFITQIGKFLRRLKNVSFMILLLNTCVLFGQIEPSKRKILIDAGHGGIDAGAIGINGIMEKDVVMKIANEVIRLNTTLLDNKHDIFLTRYRRDTLISLSDRVHLARRLKADIYISIHCNAAQNMARGLEVYVHDSQNVNTKKSIALGEMISKECIQNIDFESRGIKFANFQVLRGTKDFCASVLVETGFITQNDEAGYLKEQKNCRAIALAILQGTNHYLNTL